MGGLFAPYRPDQGVLFPQSPRDWLPEGHLVHFVLDVIGQLDLSAFKARYRGGGSGNVAYHPQMMLALLVYGYCTGVRSSRKIARAIEDHVAFRLIAAEHSPGHRTIARFRERHIDQFKDVFRQIVRIAQEADLVSMGTLAIDGSKFKANASNKASRTYQQLNDEEQRLEQEIDSIVQESQAIDAKEDALYGDARGDELPSDLSDKTKRLDKIRAAKQRVEQRQRERDADKIAEAEEREKAGEKPRGRKRKRPLGTPKDSAQENLTDPDCRIMKTASGVFIPGFNAQIAVDGQNQLIVAADVSQCAGDQPSLVPMALAARNNTGRKPEHLVVDAGYRSEDGFRAMEEEEIDTYGALAKKGKPLPDSKEEAPATARMLKKLQTEAGKQIYGLRQRIVEPVFAWVKRSQHFLEFLMRSHRKVCGEWDLNCASLNLKRMATLMPR